jgi:hypothetical protein
MRISKKESIEYLRENYSKKTKDELTSYLGLSWSYIQKLCCLNDIKREFVEGKNYGKYFKLMDLKSPETCYWIGFLLADGHIYKETNIQMNLSIHDKDHVLKLQKYLGEFPILEYKEQIRICISDKKLSKFLSSKFNWKSNKTKVPPIFPKLSNVQMFSLIIGFIDGDGSISKNMIRVKCDYSWKTIIENFYFLLVGENKNFNKTSCGCSIIYISQLETLFKIKERAEKLNLPILERKWSKIKRRILRQEKSKIVKKLIDSGLSIKEIQRQTGFGYTIIYKISRQQKDLEREYQRKF